MLRPGLAALLAAGCAPALAAQPLFEDVSASLPVRHVYDGDWEFYVGGGAAVFDCDANGYPDIFAAGGSNPSLLLRNVTGEPGKELRFETLPDAPETRIADVTGAYPVDIDGDGVLDLFVMRVGANRALRGLGDCRFTDATAAWSIDPGKAWTTAFSAAWEPGRSWPTLAVGNYVDRVDPSGPFGACDTHQLFRPGDGGYLPAEPIAPGYCTLSMLFTDWSGTGRQDLWISNDRHYYVRDGEEQLFRITPSLAAFGGADGWRTHKLWGMGIASRDITGDGLPEVAVTSMADQKLFTLAEPGAGPDYKAISYERNMTVHVPYRGDDGRPSTGWHVQFGDIDNDGLDDVFIAKGNVNQMPSSAMKDPDNLLMQQPDGTFLEAGDAAGVSSMERGRGAALADFNRDGLLDLLVVQRRAPLALYRNVSRDTGHWVDIRLGQPVGNRLAIGAKIELDIGDRTVLREIQLGGGHAGGQAVPEHFGTGAATALRMRVHWPDGVASDWLPLSAGRLYEVVRGAGGAAQIAASAPRP